MSRNLAYTVKYFLEKKDGIVIEEISESEFQEIDRHLPNISDMSESDAIEWLDKNLRLEIARLNPIFYDDAHLYKKCTLEFSNLLLVEKGSFTNVRKLIRNQIDN
jgi:hypothetical protein